MIQWKQILGKNDLFQFDEDCSDKWQSKWSQKPDAGNWLANIKAMRSFVLWLKVLTSIHILVQLTWVVKKRLLFRDLCSHIWVETKEKKRYGQWCEAELFLFITLVILQLAFLTWHHFLSGYRHGQSIKYLEKWIMWNKKKSSNFTSLLSTLQQLWENHINMVLMSFVAIKIPIQKVLEKYVRTCFLFVVWQFKSDHFLFPNIILT